MSFPAGSAMKESTCNAGDAGLIPRSARSPGDVNSNPTRVFLPGESHGQRSLMGYRQGSCTESDMTERLNSNFPWPHSLSPLVHDPTGHCLLFLASLPRDGSSIKKCIPSMDIPTPFLHLQPRMLSGQFSTLIFTAAS